MSGAKLKGASLRGSNIEGLAVNAKDVEGAIVIPCGLPTSLHCSD